MRIFHTGFETGAIMSDSESLVPSSGSATAAAATGTVPGSWSTYALHIQATRGSSGGAAQVVEAYNISPSPSNEVYFRGHMYCNSVSDEQDFLQFRNAAGIQCSLSLVSSGAQLLIKAYRGGASAGTLIGTASYPAPSGVYFTLEVHLAVGGSGTLEVRVNNTPVITFSGNTQQQTGSDITTFQLQCATQNSGGNVNIFWDDVAINDTGGTINKSWVGEGRIVALPTNGAGDATDLTKIGAAASNWQSVNEVPSDTTTYVQGGNSGLRDLYNIADTDATVQTVNAVCVWLRGEKPVSGSLDLGVVIKTSLTESVGPALGLTGAWAYKKRVMDTNPITGVQWTKSDVDGLQVGPQTI